MLSAIAHRGPDQSGSHEDAGAAIGSRRLSIIDVENGRQPISSGNGSRWIVFNGEIYNYRALREFLLKRGYNFRTDTDTEVLLLLYDHFGTDCLRYLNGIFAFAIWDAERRELVLARDHIGIKPVYYADMDGLFVFSSEMKGMLAHPEVHRRREIDLLAFNEYLSFEYVPTPHTIVAGIRRLEPGCWLTVGESGVKQGRYWQLDLTRSEQRPPVHWRDFALSLRSTLESSVESELVSDVPVGVLLSGGVDSSTITAMMARHYAGKIQSFSIGFEEASFDESRYARIVAERIGTEHQELIVTSQLAAEVVPTIMDHLDEPFGDSSFIPTYLVSKFASRQVKVVLGGDGGDELFAGYPTYKAHRLIAYYESIVPWWVRSHVMPRLLDRLPTSFDNISLDFKLRRFLAGRGVSGQARHHRWLGSFMPEEKTDLISPWVQPVLDDTYALPCRHGRDSGARELINELLYTDMKMYLEGDILYKVDRASMAASLEVRVPFLNRDVVEFATQLPLELKLRRLDGKFLLKKAAADLIPKEIISRPKKGFNMPVAYWLTGQLKAFCLDMLSPERLRQHDLLAPAYVERLLDEHLNRKKDNRKQLWTLLMFQLWYDRYFAAT